MHDLPLLTNIAVALLAALVGGLVARRLRLPPLVGYLLAGVVIGPSTPGFVGDAGTLSQLAELGVALLMFGVGAHFSIHDLWRVRRVAIPGAVTQMIASTALGYALARAWGWSPEASGLLGIAISIASTVVLVRALTDRGLLDSHRGHVAVGWLVLEDLATVLVLVLLPVLTDRSPGSGLELTAWALLKAGAFVALMTIAGTRVVPYLLSRIARTRSRELFVVAGLTVALGTALASAAFFGVSIALGAFVAGVVVRESRYGHQVTADLVTFRDAFSVLFFVSIGMLVDLGSVRDHLAEIAALVALVILGKGIIAVAIVRLCGQPIGTALTVAAGLAQVGEFSFIVGQAGVSLGVFEAQQYSLILVVAVVSISLNPAVFAAASWLESRAPAPKAAEVADVAISAGHVVVVGHGRVGRHVVEVLERLSIPTLVIEQDVHRIDALRRRGIQTLFGDAASSEILTHARLEAASAMIVALPDAVATELVVGRAHDLAPALRIVARAHSHRDDEALSGAGAADTVDPQLEGAIELLRRVLLLLDVPVRDVHLATDALRGGAPETSTKRRVLDAMVRGTRDLELTWITVGPESPAAGKTLAETALRARTGASCVAITRGETLITNPDVSLRLRDGDHLAMIGAGDQLECAKRELDRRSDCPSDAPGALAGPPESEPTDT